MTWRDELKTLTDAGIEPRYPWHEWFDGSARELVQGCDYMTDSKTFYNVAFKAAQRRGLRLRGKATGAACTIVAFTSLQGGEAATQRLVKPSIAGSNPAPAADKVA